LQLLILYGLVKDVADLPQGAMALYTLVKAPETRFNAHGARMDLELS
jgi:hypothetical protein